MGEMPSGTVTFLFTDIEGSTRRWEQDPQAMRSTLAAHDEVLRSAVEGEGGLLASLFTRIEQPEIACTLYGAISAMPSIVVAPGLPATVEHLRGAIGTTRFDECVATGAAQPISEAAAYARRQIRLVRQSLAERLEGQSASPSPER
jgi:class 3 adenylate cyclase